MNISEYLDSVRTTYATGQASEHSYRPAIHKLFAGIDPTLTVINEPKKSDAGMPDFMFQRGVVPVGWTECKDIDKDIIRLKGYSVEQRKRYEKAFPNLIYTNGVDFEFIREGERIHFVSIADFLGPLGGLQPLPDKFEELKEERKHRSCKDAGFAHTFVTSTISEAIFLSGTTASNAMNMPLYLYPEEGTLDQSIRPNLDPKLYAAICKAAGINPSDQAGPDDDFRAATGEARPSEVKVFDYIYGVLHSPAYRETFSEFLKIDFPRIPYPPSPEVFRHVSAKGEQLRRLHLMEPAAIGDTPYPYYGEGDDVAASGYPKFEDGKVHINKDQYFADVPEIAWNFHIGGYQPAQKWLKDRRGRSLSFDDITHYQRIVKILVETDRIMKEINLPL